MSEGMMLEDIQDAVNYAYQSQNYERAIRIIELVLDGKSYKEIMETE